MFKALLAVSLLVLSQVAVAGSANLSITNLTGSGASLGVSSSTYSNSEVASGYRHLDSSLGGDISVRNESYVRGSAAVGVDTSTSFTTFALTGTIVNATRVGESYTNVVANTSTVGSTADASAYVEVGTFGAYDVVDNSYSYESGAYTASGSTVGSSIYVSNVDAVTDSYSAYGIYGAN